MTEKFTTAIATGAVVGTPWWVGYINAWVGLAVGVLGAVWLILQITHKLKHWDDR